MSLKGAKFRIPYCRYVLDNTCIHKNGRLDEDCIQEDVGVAGAMLELYVVLFEVRNI